MGTIIFVSVHQILKKSRTIIPIAPEPTVTTQTLYSNHWVLAQWPPGERINRSLGIGGALNPLPAYQVL